jgi:hypothetical protein
MHTPTRAGLEMPCDVRSGKFLCFVFCLMCNWHSYFSLQAHKLNNFPFSFLETDMNGAH